MKKFTTLFLIFVCCIFSSFAQKINEPELKSVGNEQIEFINYSGPHKVIDSAQSIIEIGAGMGRTISLSTPSTTGNRNKYYVIHAVDQTQPDKMNADILFLGKDASVDHIKNLRRIISGYLSAAYGYSQKDADTLAVFITVYNAVYRGKYDVFQSKYKDVVIKNLSNNCGLSINYQEWPGKSEIVIPLFDVTEGGLSTVDTSVISDSKVIDSMKEDDDKNIDPRKDMVDIKEREADQASEKAQDAQKQAVEAQKEADDAKQEADEAQKAADEAKQEALENPDDKDAQDKADQAQKEADQKKQEAEEAQKEADEAKQEAADKQAIADKKQTEAQNERKDIANDQKDIQQKEIDNSKTDSEYGMIIVNEKTLLSRLVKFNTENGDIVKKSPVTVIRNRTVYHDSSNQFIAVAGENTGNGAIKLVLLDEENMEITRESNETLAAESVLVQDGNNYYCVIDDNGKYVVAKFDSTLRLLIKSPVAVKPTTPITIVSTGVVVTDANGKLRLLANKDLTSITKDELSSGNAK